jgi:AcrR family transcriptional regulator
MPPPTTVHGAIEMGNRAKPGENQKGAARTPIQDRAKEKKARILTAAFDLFSERGYELVGMRDIAQASGVSIGTVYAYFADKNMIFIDVFTLYSEELKSSIFSHINEGLSDHRDIEGFVYGLLQRFFDIFHNRLKIHRDAILLSLVDDQVRSIYAALERRGEQAIMDFFVERFGDRIEVRDAEAARFVVHKAIDEIIQYLLFYEVPIDRDRVFRETARMIARYIEKR